LWRETFDETDADAPDNFGWFRVDPATGNRELVTILPLEVMHGEIVDGPEPSFFPPAVATSLGSGF
jgi:hypothetical protein